MTLYITTTLALHNVLDDRADAAPGVSLPDVIPGPTGPSTLYRLTAPVMAWVLQRVQKARQAVAAGKMTHESLDEVIAALEAVQAAPLPFSADELADEMMKPGWLQQLPVNPLP